MWRDRYAYFLAHKNATSFLFSIAPGEVYAPRPPAPFTRESLDDLFAYLAAVNGPGPGLSRVEGLAKEQSTQAHQWGYAPRVVATDYVYDRAKTSGLHGDTYRDRRNEVNRLARNHAALLRPLRPTDLSDCRALYERWKNTRAPHLDAVGVKMLEHSRKAHERLLTQYEAWGLGAWGLWVDNRLAAYTAAGSLSEDTLGVLVEVSDLTLPGAAAYIFVHLCRLHMTHAWVNTGDAEFLPGLKESKEHWHPAQRRVQYALDPKK